MNLNKHGGKWHRLIRGINHISPWLQAAACPSLCVVSHPDENKEKGKHGGTERSGTESDDTESVWLAVLTLSVSEKTKWTKRARSRTTTRHTHTHTPHALFVRTSLHQVLAGKTHLFWLILKKCKAAKSLIEFSLIWIALFTKQNTAHGVSRISVW